MAEQAASQGHRVEQREGPHGQQRAAFVFSSGPQLTPVPHGTELPASEPRQPLPGPQAAPARCRLRDELPGPGPGPCPAAPRWLPGGAPAAPGAGPEGSVGGCERPRAPPAAASVRGRGGLEAKRSPGGARPRRRPAAPAAHRPAAPSTSPHLTAAPARPGGAGGSPRPPPALTARRAPRAATARNMAPPPPPRAALARAAPPPPPPHWAPRRANGRAPLPAPCLSPPTGGRGQRAAGGWGGREAREGPLAEGGKRAVGGGQRGGAARAAAPSARSCKGLREARWSQGAIQLFRPEELEDQ